jgi:hypothetical protein
MLMTVQDQNHSYDAPTREQALNHFLQSIAMEEEALARLLHAEADKALSFVGKNQDFPNSPSNDEIITFNRSVISILDSLLMAEWLLLKKLDAALHMNPAPLASTSLQTQYSREQDDLDNRSIDY